MTAIRACILLLTLLSSAVIATETPSRTESCQSDNELLQWAAQGQFDRLEQRINNAIADYEKGAIEDKAVRDLYRDVGDKVKPCHGPMFDAWARTKPNSYAASLMRGVALLGQAFTVRGGRWGDQLTDSQVKRFKALAQAARVELTRSLTLHPRPLFSHEQLIGASMLLSDKKLADTSLAAARKIDITNTIARSRYIDTVVPQWGGSYKQMWAVIEDMKVSGAPSRKIACLERKYFKIWMNNEDPPDAKLVDALAPVINGLCSEAKDYYARGSAYHRMDKFDKAIADYTIAVNRAEDAKQKADYLYWRGAAYEWLNQFDNAIADYSQSESLGGIRATLAMGRLYYYGKGPIAKDMQKSFELCKRVVDQDTTGEAARCLANHYSDGLVTKQDNKQAQFFLVKAAKMGDAAANMAYGDHLWDGYELKQDRAGAVHGWCIASRGGIAEADERLRENVGFDATTAQDWSCEDFAGFYATPEWRKAVSDPGWYFRRSMDRLGSRFRN